MARGGRRRWTALAALGAAACALCLAAAACLVWMHGRAAAPSPSPASDPAAQAAASADGGWPEVDWDYWLSVNPDVVGWVSVPGTSVSQPVVQAPAADPGYYLSHDVYGNWNPWGAVYLDAECAEGGLLGSPNAVVYGHHMDDGSMFAELASYSDPEWAAGHAAVLVQTPDGSRAELGVRYAQVVDNASLPKRTSFSGAADFDAWYEEGLARAAAVVDAEARPERVLSLVTCSYGRYADERTVAVCSEERPAAAVRGEARER